MFFFIQQNDMQEYPQVPALSFDYLQKKERRKMT